MLYGPTLAYFSIWTPKVSPFCLQTCFCLLRRPEERTFDVLVYAQFFFCRGPSDILGYQGIEANLDKCRVVTKMRSLQNMKEVQQLIGRLTALSKFVPRLAEQTRPMVQLLHKAAKFSWDDKCMKKSFNS